LLAARSLGATWSGGILCALADGTNVGTSLNPINLQTNRWRQIESNSSQTQIEAKQLECSQFELAMMARASSSACASGVANDSHQRVAQSARSKAGRASLFPSRSSCRSAGRAGAQLAAYLSRRSNALIRIEIAQLAWTFARDFGSSVGRWRLCLASGRSLAPSMGSCKLAQFAPPSPQTNPSTGAATIASSKQTAKLIEGCRVQEFRALQAADFRFRKLHPISALGGESLQAEVADDIWLGCPNGGSKTRRQAPRAHLHTSSSAPVQP